MDTSKIIKGIVNGRNYTVTAPIVKEDYGLYLQIEGVELPSTYEVDFSNSEHNGTSVTMIGNSDGVLIPHQFIDTGKDIFAFLYHVGANYGRTVYKFRIPNKVRPDRTDDTPTPEEQSVIGQTIAALNEAVAQTAQDVVDAEASAQAAGYDADRAEEARSASLDYAEQAEASATSAEQSATASANSASASAQSASQSAQIKADVEDLADDAQGYANSAQQSATASANSASQAQGFAQSASASAQSASGYASRAQTSANTASSKATEASGYAQTASEKVSEASQSATTASNKASEASGYATASQTAQGLAEQARNEAVSAKNDAESARDDAESARDEAQQAVASISGALDDKAPVITDTASGSIASFSDGADDLPLKSLVVDINPVQDLSHGDPSPENICPISGWTEVDVEQRGKNIYDIKGWLDKLSVPYTESNGYVSFTPTSQCYLSFFELPSGTKTLSFEFGGESTATNIRFRVKYANGTIDVNATTQKTGDIVGVALNWSSVGTIKVKAQIEFGSTATPYEPYTGRSISIQLGQTVYGGKLDVLSGMLTVDRAKYIESGQTTNWQGGSAWNAWRWFADVFNSLATIPTSQSGLSKAMSDKFKATYTTWSDLQTTVGFLPRGTRLWIRFGADTELTTAQKVKEWFTANPTEFVYELAEPIEIQLTPNQVNSLLGVNNLWADSGDTETVYRADTKLYIQKKIAEAISALS